MLEIATGADVIDFAAKDLPSPQDRSQAWHCAEPAYEAWWRALMEYKGEPAFWEHVTELKSAYAFGVPNREALESLLALGPLVELGAGRGYWARLLRDLGGDVVAYDLYPPEGNDWIGAGQGWTDVLVGDVDSVADHANRTVLIGWPPRPDPMVPTLLDRYAPRTLALITDGRNRYIPDGDQLYDRLERDYLRAVEVEIPRWPATFDRLIVWRRSTG